MHDDTNLQISQALTLLRVPKFLHQWIVDILRKGPAAISPLPGLAPKIVVHLFEVTQITLPFINEEGKAIYPEYIDDEMYDHVNYPPPRTEEEEIAQANFNDYNKKCTVGAGDISEEDEDASIRDWFLKLTQAIDIIAWQQVKVEVAKEAKQAKEEDEAKEEEEENVEKEEKEEEKVEKEGEEEKEAKEEDVIKEAKEEKEGEEEKEEGQKEWSKEDAKEEEEVLTCPICMEIIVEADRTWRLMPCCTQVFHCDCISTWTKRAKKCPWCRSSLPLVLQSAKGFMHRSSSDDMYCPSSPRVHDLLMVLWHALSEKVWWINWSGHDVGCKSGCLMDMIRA
ncbi:unnamed protein product [Cuscuta campestris]|uniref:RING-type E3 ubiquitin transferase n=1 Tax=Cuscuta campestris TaxID=132261 RepID=A0A484MRD5_9ASTE|nr:unnamed protein product [Cuscuta campestris]